MRNLFACCLVRVKRQRITSGMVSSASTVASSEYQAIWDETVKWIQDGKPDGSESLPPGCKWITECLYEVDGSYYVINR